MAHETFPFNDITCNVFANQYWFYGPAHHKSFVPRFSRKLSKRKAARAGYMSRQMHSSCSMTRLNQSCPYAVYRSLRLCVGGAGRGEGQGTDKLNSLLLLVSATPKKIHSNWLHDQLKYPSYSLWIPQIYNKKMDILPKLCSRIKKKRKFPYLLHRNILHKTPLKCHHLPL